jgi:triosephosphate isomerase (TIM)
VKKNSKIIIGNWKMNPATREEAEKIARRVSTLAPKLPHVTAVLCPPSLYLSSITRYTNNKKVFAGVQNISTESKGSFTGEISAEMVKNLSAKYVIIGHSERRKMGETDDMVNKKVQLALKHKLIPVICIGEDTRDEEGRYLSVIKEQLQKALAQVPQTDLAKIIVAYEPVWAIGASSAMNAHDVHQMTIYIIRSIMELYKTKTRLKVPILYGGSVDPTNTFGILTEGEADGLLVGRQSLDPESFGEILRIANSA